jgi:hypothetical protein
VAAESLIDPPQPPFTLGTIRTFEERDSDVNLAFFALADSVRAEQLPAEKRRVAARPRRHLSPARGGMIDVWRSAVGAAAAMPALSHLSAHLRKPPLNAGV